MYIFAECFGARVIAQVAELVDALVSGTSNSNVVQVRFLSWARIVVFVSLFDVLPRWWNW